MISGGDIQPALYLLPTPIADIDPATALPAANLKLIGMLRHYVVENIRTARRFLRRCSKDIDIDALSFVELNEHTRGNVAEMLAPLRRGESIGVMSEAGCPGIADPGADLVAAAHSEGMRVVPLCGPSSIVMSLMASGFNGQNFTFHGYLPVDDAGLQRKLRELERASQSGGGAQIFIETPYRNRRMLSVAAETLRPATMICVATDITSPDEKISVMPAEQWRRTQIEIPKKPTVFIVQSPR